MNPEDKARGIYDAWEYKRIVEEAIAFWDIGGLGNLDASGCEAQEKIMAIPARLDRVAKRAEGRDQPKTFYFDFVYSRPVEID